MTVINVLGIEEYLYGVVPAEIESDAPTEAIQAQAVAARTYTMKSMNKYNMLGFDLCPTVYDQAYKGVNGESTVATAAINSTKDMLILYNGIPAEVFYFSSSGGWTESVENVWSYKIPYLINVRDQYESGKSWNYSWNITMTAEEISTKLKNSGSDIGNLINIKVNASPRGKFLKKDYDQLKHLTK